MWPDERALTDGVDTDTVGAVAGARVGADALSDRWLADINETWRLRMLAGRLRSLHG